MRQGCSEAGPHPPAQAQPKDFQGPENELQKLGNGMSVQSSCPAPARISPSPGLGWGSAGEPELGVSSNQLYVPHSYREK